MDKPLYTTETGFEVWRMDRTKSQDIWMTRADEERFCDALTEAFGPYQVVDAGASTWTPEIDWRRRITDFGSNFKDWENRDVARRVKIFFPWPGWRLQAEKLYWNDRKPETYAGYTIAESSPLLITFERAALLGVEWFTDVAWRREALVAGRYYVTYCSAGPYVAAQKEFIRKLFGIVRRMTTNRLRLLRYDAEGNQILDQPIEKGGKLWAGDDALAWVRADPERLLIEEWALNRDDGILRYGYRPLE